MTHQKRTEINEIGEFGLIDRIASKFENIREETILGIGDDAAVIKGENFYQLVATDLLVEGIHFDLMYSPLKHLGYKAVVVNLSDIYAMNGEPTHITCSLAVSSRFSVEAIEEIYEGIKIACEHYNVDLIGGDTSASHKGIMISITALGKVHPHAITYRNTAQVGDLICVSGDLGAAYLGLQILEREKQLYLNQPDIQPDLENQQYLIQRQLRPEARRDMIEMLKKSSIIPTAMIDVSDGISSDLNHICQQSKVGAIIEESGVPIHPDAQLQAIKFNLDPITCALSGGEDYELLFTIHPKDLARLRLLPDIYIMGEIVPAKEGVKLHTKGGNIHPISGSGWSHFNQAENEN